MDKIFEKFFGRVVEGNRGEFFQSKTPKKNGTIKALVITLIFFLVAEYFTLLPINLRSPDFVFFFSFCLIIFGIFNELLSFWYSWCV